MTGDYEEQKPSQSKGVYLTGFPRPISVGRACNFHFIKRAQTYGHSQIQILPSNKAKINIIDKEMDTFNEDKVNITFVNNNMHNITSASSKETCYSGTTVKQNGIKIKKDKNENLPNRRKEKPIKSKRSKTNVIPYISSIFRWPSKVKQMSVIKETQVQILPLSADNYCQTGFKRRARLRKHNKTQRCYDDQPVCTDEANICHEFILCEDTKTVREASPPFNHTYQIRNINKRKHSFSSSLEADKDYDPMSDFGFKIMPKTKTAYTQVYKKYIKNNDSKRQHNHKHQYQLYNNTTRRNRLNDASLSPKCSICRHPSSGFWEYLANKITSVCQAQFNTQTKAQNAPKDTPAPPCDCPIPYESCSCCAANPPPKPEPPPPKSCDPPKPPPKKCKCPLPKANAPAPDDNKKPCQLPHDLVTKALSEKYKQEIVCVHNPQCILINGCLNIPGNDDNSMTVFPIHTQNNACENQTKCVTNLSNLKTQGCQYTPFTKIARNEACQYSPGDTRVENLMNKTIESCQYCHSVEQSDEEYSDEDAKDKSPKETLLDQFGARSYIEVSSIQSKDIITRVRKLKMPNKLTHRQSPICQVMKTLCRPKEVKKVVPNDPCYFVPKCDNIIPVRVLVNKPEKTCLHSTKCDDEVCTRKYTVFTARDEEITKAEPASKNMCSHKPPCIMIPKCLTKFLFGDLADCEAIPDCNHQPMCKMMPACRRKKKRRNKEKKEVVSGASSSNPTEKRASTISWSKRWKAQRHGRLQHKKMNLRC